MLRRDKFTNGALTGAYVTMYNHMQHGNDPRTQGKEFNTKDEMETFMLENSRKDGVELASYVFKNKNGEYKYFVQPWDKNLADKSTNYQSFIDQYVNQGYYVEAQIHTHLTSFPSMPGLSSIDMEFYHSSGIKSIYCIEPNCYYFTSREWMAPLVFSDGKNRTYGFKINSLPFP